MMVKQWSIVVMMTTGVMAFCVENEFVVSKKTKAKKELAADVQQDIVGLLETALRQIGSNITESVIVQNKIFDMIKEMCADRSLSTAQLKDLRARLEKELQQLQLQQRQLQEFFLVLS